jgi:hypothetical protein
MRFIPKISLKLCDIDRRPLTHTAGATARAASQSPQAVKWVPCGIKVTVQQSYGRIGFITTFRRRGVMKADVNEQLGVRIRRAAVALIAKAAMAAGTVHASPPSPVVMVPPTDPPALARQTGDAMLLQESIDRAMMLYIEQNQGARLATFDATDPLQIKPKVAFHFDDSGLFDFTVPMTGALKVTHPASGASPALNYFGAIDPVFTYELNRMFDVKQVRAQLMRTHTGTTFMRAEDGL